MGQPIILVAENEFILARDLCSTVEEAGYAVDGPFEDVPSAMHSFRAHRPDLAILDIELMGEDAFPLAEQLIAEDVPVIFHSGNGCAAEASARFPQARTMAKPCPPAQMIENVQRVLADA